MLGIRAAIKKDIGASAAELVYGTALRLPGQLIVPTRHDTVDPADYVQRLKDHMSALAPTATRRSPQTSFIHRSLDTCTHIFLRIDAVRKPLQPPYLGPFKVLKRNPKFFVIEQKGKHVSVSIDRLKPAFLESVSARTTAADVPLEGEPTVYSPLRTALRATSAPAPAPAPTPASALVKSRPTARVTRSGRHWPQRYVQVHYIERVA
eukprot:XP_011662837.1 PREDICTED: uncharacterized protein LOC105437667 [Strongylocentrotus purpuratus]